MTFLHAWTGYKPVSWSECSIGVSCMLTIISWVGERWFTGGENWCSQSTIRCHMISIHKIIINGHTVGKYLT